MRRARDSDGLSEGILATARTNYGNIAEAVLEYNSIKIIYIPYLLYLFIIHVYVQVQAYYKCQHKTSYIVLTCITFLLNHSI